VAPGRRLGAAASCIGPTSNRTQIALLTVGSGLLLNGRPPPVPGRHASGLFQLPAAISGARLPGVAACQRRSPCGLKASCPRCPAASHAMAPGSLWPGSVRGLPPRSGTRASDCLPITGDSPIAEPTRCCARLLAPSCTPAPSRKPKAGRWTHSQLVSVDLERTSVVLHLARVQLAYSPKRAGLSAPRGIVRACRQMSRSSRSRGRGVTARRN
jgi:hypothetical protein